MERTRGRPYVVCGLLTLAALPSPARAGRVDLPPTPATAPATAPAADPATQLAGDEARVNRAIAELGSGNFRVREEAANVLWALGDKAVPALKEAAGGD